jgi:hypothetical protein
MLRASHQEEGVCYASVRWRRHIALNVLGAGGRLFLQTSVIRHLDRLAQLNEKGASSMMAMSRLLWRLDPPVIDAVRIVCCFENLFKARLLLSGCVIHEIDRNKDRSLWELQRKAPLLIREVKRREGLSGLRDIDYSFALLKQTTLAWRVLGEADYQRRIGIDARLFEVLSEISSRRNTLHFLAPTGVLYGARQFNDLRYIRACYNRFVVCPHKRLLRRLGFPPIHELKEA